MKRKDRQKAESNFILKTGVILLAMLTLLAVLVPIFSGQSYAEQNPHLQHLAVWRSAEQWGL